MRTVRSIVRAAAALLCVQAALILTGPPQCLEDWLDRADVPPHKHPRYIVVLGGGGIPSETSLTRCYYAATYGRGLTGTSFVVSLPTDGDPETSGVGRMRDELVLRGIAREAIRLESRGLNTRQQAANVRALLGDAATREPVLVVTSHLHMRRSLLCFQKAGFTDVTGLVAGETWAEAKGGPWVWLRYTVWSNAVREIHILRELLALFVCKLT